MIEAEIPPAELRELEKDIKALYPEKLLKGELGPFVKEVGAQVGKYPPPVPASSYTRTGHLGRSWVYNVINSLSAEVGNFAKYAGYVHGIRQVEQHRAHGWRRLFEMGGDMWDEFIDKLSEKAGRIWRS